MRDPSDVLGLPPTAVDAAVRRRYLELVRQYPPDQSPERFAEIHAAYDQLRDPATRLEREIFEAANHDSFDDILADMRRRLQGRRIPVEVLLSLGDA